MRVRTKHANIIACLMCVLLNLAVSLLLKMRGFVSFEAVIVVVNAPL